MISTATPRSQSMYSRRVPGTTQAPLEGEPEVEEMDAVTVRGMS